MDATEFPADVVQALPSKDWRVPQLEINKRRDLRNHRIFTIDPATAKDLDDALHITKLPDGTLHVTYNFLFLKYSVWFFLYYFHFFYHLLYLFNFFCLIFYLFLLNFTNYF